MMLLLLPLTALAGSTALSRLDEASTQYNICELNAREFEQYGDWQAAVDAWDACEKEMQRRGLAELEPKVRGRLILANLQRDYQSLRERDPVAFAQALLITVAAHPELEFPVEVVRKEWLRLVQDDGYRQNSEKVRSVSVRWMGSGGLTPEQVTTLEGLVRRDIGDMGFKLPVADSASAGQADIVIRPEVRLGSVSEVAHPEGVLYQERVQLRAPAPRFRSANAEGRPIQLSRTVEDTSKEGARTKAIEQASAGLAEALLFQVVGLVFSNQPMPEP